MEKTSLQQFFQKLRVTFVFLTETPPPTLTFLLSFAAFKSSRTTNHSLQTDLAPAFLRVIRGDFLLF